MKLLESLTSKEQHFNNRVAMAPMTRCRAIGGVPNQLMAEYYGQRSTAGLIISEGVSPSPNGMGYARMPGVYSPEQLAGWKTVAQAAKKDGALLFMQLMHCGRVGHAANMPQGAQLLAPSAIGSEGDMWTDTEGMQKTQQPREMTLEDIAHAKEEFVQAAKNAVAAGFDGVELHSANGYVLEQFINAGTNQRTDAYGGSVQNRTKFVVEVATAVGEAIGFNRVGIRFSPYNQFNGMPAYEAVEETYTHLVSEMEKLGILYVHVIDFLALGSEEGRELLQTMRNGFSGLFIRNGGYDAARAEATITSGEADLISFGNPFIANPDLVSRIQKGQEWAKPNTETFYTADEKGFTDYPVAG